MKKLDPRKIELLSDNVFQSDEIIRRKINEIVEWINEQSEPVELPKHVCWYACDCTKPEPKEKSLCDAETEVTYWCKDEMYCDWYTCNECGGSNINDESNFCPGCGRKIIK